MSECRGQALEDYVRAVASARPTPGGGSVSALVGALAAALTRMAAGFTAGREAYAGAADEAEEILRTAADLDGRLLALVDEDVRAYSAVAQAMAMPRQTAPQKKRRHETLQKALRAAAEPPLQVVRSCAEVGELATRIAQIGNRNLVSDTAAAGILAEAAAVAAALQVRVNLHYLEDPQFEEGVCAQIERLTGRLDDCRRVVTRLAHEHLEG